MKQRTFCCRGTVARCHVELAIAEHDRARRNAEADIRVLSANPANTLSDIASLYLRRHLHIEAAMGLALILAAPWSACPCNRKSGREEIADILHGKLGPLASCNRGVIPVCTISRRITFLEHDIGMGLAHIEKQVIPMFRKVDPLLGREQAAIWEVKVLANMAGEACLIEHPPAT